MFISFFLELRAAKVPASLREFLTLMEAMREGVARFDIDEFYFLARTALVKDERHLDRFDRVFGHCFKGIETPTDPRTELPEEWLRKLAERHLTEEEKKLVEALGGWEKLMETLRQRLAEQKGRHQGGNKWIGTAGTSPFGAFGYNPEGVRIGRKEGEEGGNRTAVKVWDRREFRNLDDTVELGTRNIKLALRRLRQFARAGAELELDLPGTIRSTAHNAGWLDLKMLPERHNAVKLLLFLDVGGSMDDHIRICEELFSAARGEFKHLVHFYFHNCLYDTVWKDSRRRRVEQTPVMEILRTYDPGHKIVLVGDASMSPYEIDREGGSVEHWNDEPGRVWLTRLLGPLPEGCMAQPGAREILGRHDQHRHDARADGRPHVPVDARRHRPRDARADALKPNPAGPPVHMRGERRAELRPAHLGYFCPAPHTASARPEKEEWPGLRRLGLLLLHADIGLCRVVFAVRLAGSRPSAAEMEIVIGRMADRPHTSWTGEIEDIAARRRHFLDDSRHEPDSVHLADDRILGDADAAADLGRRHPFIPEQFQTLDTLRRPGRFGALERADLLEGLQRPRSIHFDPPIE